MHDANAYNTDTKDAKHMKQIRLTQIHMTQLRMTQIHMTQI